MPDQATTFNDFASNCSLIEPFSKCSALCAVVSILGQSTLAATPEFPAFGHFRVKNLQRDSRRFFTDLPAVLIDAGERRERKADVARTDLLERGLVIGALVRVVEFGPKRLDLLRSSKLNGRPAPFVLA
jgi:hypothetical protein